MKKFKVKIVKTLTWEEIEVEANDEESAVAAAESRIENEGLTEDENETTDNEVEVLNQEYTVTMFMVVKIDVKVEASSPEEALELAGEDTSYSLGDADFEEAHNESDWEVHDEDGDNVTPGRRKRFGY